MATGPRLLALVGPTACGKTDAGIALARSLGAEICSVDSMLVYRGMDIGTAKPTAHQRGSCGTTCWTSPSPPSGSPSPATRPRARGDRWHPGPWPPPLLVGGSGLYFRALADELIFPGEDPTVRAQLEDEAEAVGVGRLFRRLEDLDPVAAAKIEPGNVRRVVRALEVAAITGSPFSAAAAAGTATTPRVCSWRGSRSRPEPWPPASRIASRRCSLPAGSTRCVDSSSVDSAHGSPRARRSGTRARPPPRR